MFCAAEVARGVARDLWTYLSGDDIPAGFPGSSRSESAMLIAMKFGFSKQIFREEICVEYGPTEIRVTSKKYTNFSSIQQNQFLVALKIINQQEEIESEERGLVIL